MKKNGHRAITEYTLREALTQRVQRFYCCDCHRSFVARHNPGRRVSQELCEEIVRRHVEGGESYRNIARWIKRESGRRPSPGSLQRVVEDIASRCKTAWEMSRELRPRWDGVVLLDEKMCPVRRKGQWLYLAVDTTGDIMHCRPVPELSSTEAAKFLKEVLELGVQLKAVVTDIDPALTRAVAAVCAQTPHQYCVKHALAAIGILIGYAERVDHRRRRTRSELDEDDGEHRHHDCGKDQWGKKVCVAEQAPTCTKTLENGSLAALSKRAA